VVERTLEQADTSAVRDLDSLVAADAAARGIASEQLGKIS